MNWLAELLDQLMDSMAGEREDPRQRKPRNDPRDYPHRNEQDRERHENDMFDLGD